MTLDKRSTAMLIHLLNAESYVPIREIMQKFKVSRRTMYNDIEKINGWLQDQDLNELSYVRSTGYYLDDKTKEHLPNKIQIQKPWNYIYSTKERKTWIAICLLVREHPLFLEDLAEKVCVSRNTTIEDLKNLKNEMDRFELAIEFDRKIGYVVEGKEDNKRKAIVYYLSLILPEQGLQSIIPSLTWLENHFNHDENLNFFKLEDFQAVQSILIESEKDLNLQFTDDILYSLVMRLLIFSRRLFQGNHIFIDPVEKEVLKETKEFYAAKEISKKLSDLVGFPYPDNETFYITKHLLGSKIQCSYTPTEEHNNEQQLLQDVVEKMIKDFQRYACVFLENRDLVEKNLLLHTRPAFYRIKYGLEIDNELTEQIKEKYKDIYYLTQKVVHHLEKAVGKPISEHETSLIAMHFGGWMRRSGVKPAIRKKVLLVCGNGIGTSRILQSQLEGLFLPIDIVGSLSLREYEKKQYDDIDLVISTTSVQKKDIPVVVVSPILTEAEKESLLVRVNAHLSEKNSGQMTSIDALMDIIQKHTKIKNEQELEKGLRQYLYQTNSQSLSENYKPSLVDLLTKERVQLVQEIKDWKKAIKVAAAPLLEDGTIEKKYVQSMITNIKEMGPYVIIAPNVAIPHAKPEDGVNKLGMSLLLLKKPVPFSDRGTDYVKLVIVLASIDGDKHLKALSELTTLMNNNSNMEKLMSADSSDTILQLITFA